MALYAFDGTGQEDQMENDKDTNVVRFARAYRGRRFYRTGVGTRWGRVGAVVGGWIGAGLEDRVDEALSALKANFARDDRTIDIVGFSRGAAAALDFANQVWETVGKRQPDAPPIRFVGLFDTVASTGVLPGPIDIDLDLELPPNVRKCCHAMALDEGRASFHLHRMKPRGGAQLAAGTIEEVWFRGCHSDVGGGDRHEPLANIPLCWMMRRAAEAGVSFDADEVRLAIAGRDGNAAIRRTRLDFGLLKRKVRAGDAVHWSVSAREKIDKKFRDVWHVNPPSGCLIVGDSGEPRGAFPASVPWPIEIDWANALQPRPQLQPGGPPISMPVFADTEWNEVPHVFLERGGRYAFTVTDGPHDWKDGDIVVTAGANGYELPALKPFKRFARKPDAEWYALVGAVDRAELFRIGATCVYEPKRSGEFGCFANDAWFKYGNNTGRLGLSVSRLA